jgi:elongation factor Ts
MSVSQLIATKVGKLGESIAVRRFVRYKVGDPNVTIASTKVVDVKPEGEE